MPLEDNAGWHEIANNCHDKQDCVPDFAIGLVLLKLTHKQEACQHAERDACQWDTYPHDRLSELQPKCSKKDKNDQLQKVSTVGLEDLFVAFSTDRRSATARIRTRMFLSLFCH